MTKRRVALAWVCDNGHQALTANELGGRDAFGGYRTLVADAACLRHTCACGLPDPPSAGSLDRCRSVPCGAPAHLVLVDAVCAHPFRINEHLGHGQCGMCGEVLGCSPDGDRPASSEQAAIDDAMALTRMYG